MSGGSLDYVCYRVEEHVGCFGDKQLDDLLKDVAQLLHDREWYLSGDTCEGAWNLAKKEFKEKWLEGEYSQYYCRDCRHFRNESLDSHYGRCEFEKHCLVHEYESACKKFKWLEGAEDAGRNE